MIVKIKGMSTGNWFLFDADEVEWNFIHVGMNPKEEQTADRIFFNEKEDRPFFYRIFIKKTNGDYRMFVCNTEVYILNNEGNTVEILR